MIPKSKNHWINIRKMPVTGFTFCLVNRRHTGRYGNFFDSFPILLTKVEKRAEGRKIQGVICKLTSCQLNEICCIIRQLVDLSCIRSNGGHCIAISFGDGLLAVVGIFLPPVEEVLPHAFMNIIVKKTRKAIFLAACLAQGRSGN